MGQRHESTPTSNRVRGGRGRASSCGTAGSSGSIPAVSRPRSVPPSTHRVFFKVARMCARSASSSVCGFQLSAAEASRDSSPTGTRNSGPELRITARSITFSSSRTFPGQL